MAQENDVHYYPRTVDEWTRKAWAGKVTLADFQRSFVWDSGRVTGYIKSILMGKPVGLYLILKTSEKPQFAPRPFYHLETPLDDVTELVLDGQQRLTSLMHALYSHPERRFFIQVADMSAAELEVVDVVCESINTSTKKTGKGLDDPATAYSNSLIPMDILRKDGRKPGKLSRLATWCISVGANVSGMEGNKARLLEDRIMDCVNERFFQRSLWYCLLPATTGSAEAAEIFVETNRSSVRIKAFDIEVASARGKHNEDLRNAIQDAYEQSDILSHYFSDDPEDYIPAIGEWMLKVACLHAGHIPKESNYEKAVSYLLDTKSTADAKERLRRLDSLFFDLNWGLRRVEGYGAASERMVPSWPTLHVLSALRSNMEKIKGPEKKGLANELLRAYYWRCLFSNRHDVRANDRLYEDFAQLDDLLDGLGGELARMTAFNDDDHPLYDKKYLLRHANWIGSGRLGKALASVVMASEPKPVDWMTNETLSATVVRELERARKLDRHHVFPRDALQAGKVEKELIQNGLNGVLLDRRTNLRLWKVPPHEYVCKMLAQLKISKTALERRIAGHRVPYDQMTDEQGTIHRRYTKFLQRRAELMAELVAGLAEWPA